jgi:ribonuclease R
MKEMSPLDILEFLQSQARHPLTAREIFDHFAFSRPQRQAAMQLLKSLVEEGTLVHIKGDRYSLPRQINLVTGTVSAHRDGYGFVVPASGEGSDVFVPARFMREVMHGDRVVVRVEHGLRSARPEGRIIRVLERAHQTVVGRFEIGRRFGYVVPADPRLGTDLFIPKTAARQVRPGQMVVARIDTYPGRNRSAEGTIIEVLGDPADPDVEILTIAYKYGLPVEFPAEVLAAVARVPDQVEEADRRGREDLRPLATVTIDGETAKDFDDAVSVRREEEGRIRLWVSIADVGHYVEEGSPVDLEAYERGTSVYFPGKCIPMLPEKLSNGICSLNPEVERLAMTAEMLFDQQGHRLESRFYPSVIRSRARLTYTEVAAMVADEDQATIARYPEVYPHLRVMAELALRLTAMRRQRGSLDFDLPEAEIILDLQGRPENIVRAERNMAHRLIEEFMLAANEAVATFLAGRGAPFLYRIHEPPSAEKLVAFQEFIGHFNYGISLDKGGVDPRKLQELLAQLGGKPEERMINQVLLRCMKQAHYAPENVGHFGLAADLYCHFTSPIRRYPDLVVHRALRQVLVSGKMPEKRQAKLQQILPAMGEHTSQRERRAMEAEREIISLKKCQFMADKVGEVFAGFVSGVQPFGFFVELKDLFVEGLVHISSIADDFYVYEEDLHRLVGQHRRRIFQVGDEVRVTVTKVDLDRREIDFVLAGEESEPRAAGPKARVQSPGSKVQRPGSKVLRPGSTVQKTKGKGKGKGKRGV